MSRSIFFNFKELPIVTVTPYVNRYAARRARKLIQALPSINRHAYDKGTKRFGALLVRIIKRAMKTGLPPGGRVSWPPLSEKTQKIYAKQGKGTGKPWYWLGQMYREVGIQDTQRYGRYVGFTPGIKGKRMSRGRITEGTKTLTYIAKLLESGTMDWIPARPLFRPAFDEAGGTNKLTKYLIQEIRKECNKYEFRNNRIHRK